MLARSLPAVCRIPANLWHENELNRFNPFPSIQKTVNRFLHQVLFTFHSRLNDKKKIFIIILGFIALILARQLVLRFHFNLGYLYLMLVCLSSLWFGLKGGLIATVAASGIFLIEVNFLNQLPNRDIVLQTLSLRFIGYAWGGILTGFLSEHLKMKKNRKNAVAGNSPIKSRFLFLLSSFKVKIAFIALSYLLVEGVRFTAPGLSLFLDYCTIILICIGGFWFGLKGGLVTATVTFSFFILEAYASPGTALARYFLQDLTFSFFFCYLIGFIIGIFSEIETRVKTNLQNLAYLDELTGCVNYRSAIQVLEKEISRAARHKKNMTLVILDIDDFKRINDANGHKTGNEILKLFAASAIDNLRVEDTVARFGGDEFLFVLPETSPAQSLQVLEKIRVVFSKAALSLNLNVTFSAGISCYPQHGHTKDMLFCSADNALFEAKNRGKDQIRMERREYIRLKPAPDIAIRFVDSSKQKELTDLKVENLSCKGMLLLIPEKTDIGKEFLCIIRPVAHDRDLLEIPCKVVFSKKMNDQFYMGVSFPELSEDTLKKIAVMNI